MNSALLGDEGALTQTEIALKETGLGRTDGELNEYQQADVGLYSNSWMRSGECIMHNIIMKEPTPLLSP